ncbi:acyl-CoA dehydrogenase family protein [Amycolatopsis sp. Poz14]|uniref:acyl-CoA dehydrogenase family protein n=1 Tax=Amycolatopsis sp. Poz14 TaxID=1447705 RepID=UPI001EE854F1|nr:acyl-CoA dehydrogenase family protein [Amycolatopsis sp. Poz14]MCG3754322.1 acyl-CoA dehydrogenase family protein [Amycolatopsis sp. Poz14]
MRRELFTAAHEDFRALVRTFLEREVLPRYPDWERAGAVDRDVWRAAGKHGLLGMDLALEYGGGGADDYRYHVVLAEEFAAAGVHAPALSLHNEVVGAYLKALATPEQRTRWLPGFCSGELITAIAITEPDAGSDLTRLRTTARPDGRGFRLTGRKTFISHGELADLVLVLAKTGKRDTDFGLFAVERTAAGFAVGKRIDKLGMRALDTVEMVFEDVSVPAANVVGHPGRAMGYLLRHLKQERLWIAVSALAGAERVFADTVGYCRVREVSGGPLTALQHTRFVLAELATELSVARTFTDRCVAAHADDMLGADEAAMAKWWNTELAQRTTDRCLQLHGGYGYTHEFAVGRAFVDSRVQTIYGGTTEVMKETIAQSLI